MGDRIQYIGDTIQHMIVKLINRMAGPEGNYPPGFLLETGKDTATALIKGGYAVATTEEVEIITEKITEKEVDINGNELHNNRRAQRKSKKG